MGGAITNNTNGVNWGNVFNFNFNFQLNNDTCVDATQALRMLLQSQFAQDSMVRGGGWGQQQIPMCGCMPPPQVQFSGAPAGKGLSMDEAGWPKGTVTTAGGYRVVPEGNTNWNIYAPGQKPGETPHTRVWGDPHVNEKDGTRWDFTGTTGADGKTGNDFLLPDGTRIFAQTSSNKGHSVTTGLEIVNGADHVSISNMQGKPNIGAITQDGYEWRAQHVAGAGDRATFHLAGDNENVHWMRETRGQLEGVITGAKDVNGSYDQIVDKTLTAKVGAGMAPPFGSPAWGNQIRGQINDLQAGAFGNVGGFGQTLAALVGGLIHSDHLRGMLGGWGSYFPTFDSPMNALGMLRELLVSDNMYQRELRYGMTANTRFV
ncbi:DUF1521 domain-containing protein [Myxococcota bacterium]|nr:DUF1521 domain-containing protein [Myxococcota bacterium]